MTGRRLAPVEIARIQELARAGVPTGVIAKRFDRHVKTIRAILRLASIAQPGRSQRVITDAYGRQQSAHGRRAHAAHAGAPAGITARPFTDDWWTENNGNFVAAMRRVHPERELAVAKGTQGRSLPESCDDDSRGTRSSP